jgi:hypothetical protein
VLKRVRATFGFFSLVFGMMLWTKIDTTMGKKLGKSFEFSEQV